MSAPKSKRKGCRDVFKAFLVCLAVFAGPFEFPVIQKTNWVPNRVIAFSKAISCKDFNQWVHFYEYDYLFERLWNKPERYLEILRRFNGVILPDFSVYRDMPLVMQLWNIYRSRAIGFWLQINGIKVIVNIRFGDHRTYRFCCDGVANGGTIAIGTNGACGDDEDRYYLEEGLAYVVKHIKPETIVVYGPAPDSIFAKYAKQGIKIIQFDCATTVVHKEV